MKKAIFFEGCSKVFSKACISHSTFYSWVSQFREGRTSTRDKPRSERPAETVTPAFLYSGECGRFFLQKSQSVRVTRQYVANQFSILFVDLVNHQHIIFYMKI